jgi:hypothetical protein
MIWTIFVVLWNYSRFVLSSFKLINHAGFSSVWFGFSAPVEQKNDPLHSCVREICLLMKITVVSRQQAM